MRPLGPLLSIVVAAALTAAPLMPLRAQDDREAVAAELERVRGEIAEIQSRIDENLGSRDRLLESLAEAERSVGSARRAQAEADQALERVRQEIDALETRRAELESRIGRLAGELARQLATAYRQGNPSRLQTLLDQDDPRRLSRRLAYHGYLTRARVEAIDALRESVENLARTRERLDEEAREQAELLEVRKAETQRLEAAMDERSRALAALDERLETDRERLAGLQSDAEELGRLLDQLAGVLADVPPEVSIPPFSDLRGGLAMPVEGAVLHGFGESRGAELEWTGWLIDVEPGEEVASVAHGRVAYADWLRGYGLLLILDHGDGYMSLYAHNEALMRDVGDWVAPGDLIALTGRSGGVSEPALYFELRYDGRPVDPAAWIER
ncbi:MAG: peptidoglycan DD-metalloendopeptidase family protein [Gammaproteobacteria bacterium]|nr:peptidoglycan DD-metalloendopeptidase family protein [Gammaproteobacteria bacterium]